jgi:hypothetical protein
LRAESAPGDTLRGNLRDAKAAIEAGRDKVASLRAGAPGSRLVRLSARLRTAPGAGTTWRIDIKAALAYADSRPRMRWPWRR